MLSHICPHNVLTYNILLSYAASLLLLLLLPLFRS
jgi:hypothetical protein